MRNLAVMTSDRSGCPRPTDAAIHPRSAFRPAPRGRVLVVDDDEFGRHALASVLRAEGFTVATAADGDDALEEVARLAPDLVLTDLQMPGLDGAALCRQLQADHPDLPVIVLTASADIGSVVECMRGGAEDYITKPLQREAIVWSVERALSRRAARGEQQESERDLNERLLLSGLREQELAENAVQQREQLTALLAKLAEGVVVAEPGGALIMVNDTARAILGLAEEGGIADVHGLAFEDLAGGALTPDRRPLARALRGECFTDEEVSATTLHGGRRRLVCTGTSVRDAQNHVTLAIVVFRDVTDLRAVEQRRDELVALVSHDLRNPLAVMLMVLSLLKETPAGAGRLAATPTARDELVARAERNGRRMLKMLTELSDVAALESSSALALVLCDVRTVVADAVDAVDDPECRITVEVQSDTDFAVLGDPPALARVVANLLTNALKYSADDTPVALRLGGCGDDVVVEVSDNGIGIPPESVKRLFDRYYRCPGANVRAKGLGLGLYISRLIADGHHGRLEVGSEVGKGTTLSLTLPRAFG